MTEPELPAADEPKPDAEAGPESATSELEAGAAETAA